MRKLDTKKFICLVFTRIYTMGSNEFFTEKSILWLDENKYVFEMKSSVTKTQIRVFFKTFYDLSLVKINTYQRRRSTSRQINLKSTKGSLKRVIITFQPSQSLPLKFYNQE